MIKLFLYLTIVCNSLAFAEIGVKYVSFDKLEIASDLFDKETNDEDFDDNIDLNDDFIHVFPYSKDPLLAQKNSELLNSNPNKTDKIRNRLHIRAPPN